MRSASILTVSAALVAVGATAAATVPTSSGPINGPGSLTVTVADAPGDTRTPVVITGPKDFRVETTRTTVLRNLKPGTYTVAATTVPNPLGSLIPQLPSQTVKVDANVHRGVAVAYRFESPPLSPVGSPDAYAIQAGSPNNPVRWNPCRVITWGPLLPLPVGEEQRLTSAFAKASIASGVPFRRAMPGETPLINVALRFAPGTSVSGEGTMFYVADSAKTRPAAYRGELSGIIGTESSAALREALYLHEIGHVLGITHVDDPSQVMHPVVREEDAVGFAVGDTAGLRIVGAEAGCLDRPVGAKDVRATLEDGDITLTWFQPASVPPVLEAQIEITTRSAEGSITTIAPWPRGFTGAGAGGMQATTPVPPSVCESNTSVALVSTNIHGSTSTPVRVRGC